jgi:hypothetical protein
MRENKEESDAKARKEKPDLTQNEEKQVEERGTPRAAVVYEIVREEGEHELTRTISALVWSGFAAGLSMGFSLVAEGLLRSHLPDAAWSPLIYKFGYCAGFLIVILGRQQLFTENTLTVILPLLLRKNSEISLPIRAVPAIVLPKFRRIFRLVRLAELPFRRFSYTSDMLNKRKKLSEKKSKLHQNRVYRLIGVKCPRRPHRRNK